MCHTKRPQFDKQLYTKKPSHKQEVYTTDVDSCKASQLTCNVCMDGKTKNFRKKRNRRSLEPTLLNLPRSPGLFGSRQLACWWRKQPLHTAHCLQPFQDTYVSGYECVLALWSYVDGKPWKVKMKMPVCQGHQSLRGGKGKGLKVNGKFEPWR